jgi:diguanylate cyclase (GGDEF)-like protein
MTNTLIRFLWGGSLRQRFLVTPLLALVVCGLLTGAFVYESHRQNDLLSRITEKDLKAFNRYAQVQVDLMQQHTALHDLLYYVTKVDEATLYAQAKEHLYAVQQAVVELERALPPVDATAAPDYAALRRGLAESAQAYREGVGAAVAMVPANLSLAPDQLALAHERFATMNGYLVRLLDRQQKEITAEIGARVRQSRIGSTTVALAGLSIAALLFFLSRALSRVLSRSIETQIDILAELGEQAGTHAAVQGGDEVERMTRAIAAFRFALLALRENERHLSRLNRVYAVLSGINTLIVRVRDRDELFREACRIAVEHGRFCTAWIGRVDRSAMKIVPMASSGAESAFLAHFEGGISLREDAPSGNTLAARAVRQKKAMVSNAVQEDPNVLFAKVHLARGVSSIALLPLLVAGEAVGVLALYAEEPGFFDEAEMRLLTELAGDIGFGLDHLEKEEKLDYIAYYDVLTGLANRGLFLERVAQYMRSAVTGGHKLALYLFDLERFKNINDSLGQVAGDALLKQVAEWLTRNLGDANLLAHVGADRFAVVLPEIGQEGDVARSLEKTLEAFLVHPFRLNDTVFRVAAKAGVSVFPADAADADTLFKNAEAALKKAKAGGDRYLFYTQKMTEAVAGKLTLENQLRQALDKGEFVLHYQPKVSLASGKLTSAEALIRWNDPRTGLVPPGRFIPVLEETGLIHEVGRWALHEALEQYLRWRAAGLAAVRIAVNVSPLQLRSRGFIAEIQQAIGVDSHAAAGLELEITESLIMEDVKHSIATLQAIRALGVSIAIDDFGTGFSSLNYLSKLPVDTLKIDRTFIVDMTTGPEGLALVSTILNLARSLKLKVVAEGVETEEQSHLLRLLRCDEMQGYLFSKPIPGETFQAKFLVPTPQGGHPPLRAPAGAT